MLVDEVEDVVKKGDVGEGDEVHVQENDFGNGSQLLHYMKAPRICHSDLRVKCLQHIYGAKCPM